jgi:hypothetical protein
LRFYFKAINVHTPSDFSVHLIASGAGDGFERDTDFMGGNCTVREKVVSDGRNLTISVRRQSRYIEDETTIRLEFECENY